MLQEYTSELDVSLARAVEEESDGGKQSAVDLDAVMADASRAQSLIVGHLDDLHGDLNELERVYDGLMSESKDMVNEEEKEILMCVASAIDILKEDLGILVCFLCEMYIE